MRIYEVKKRFYVSTIGRYVNVGARIYRWENISKLIIDDDPQGDPTFYATVDGLELDGASQVVWIEVMEPPNVTKFMTLVGTETEDSGGNIVSAGPQGPIGLRGLQGFQGVQGSGEGGSTVRLHHEYWVDKNGDDSNDGSINSPFLTVQKACNEIGDATSAAEYDDDCEIAYTIHLGHCKFVENVALPVRPTVNLLFACGAIIEGNLTQTWDSTLWTGDAHQPKLIFKSESPRGGLPLTGHNQTGVIGDIIQELDGFHFHQIHIRSMGHIGDIKWQKKAGGSDGVGQTFLEDYDHIGVIDSVSSIVASTVWAVTTFANPNLGDVNGIGGISGKTSFGLLDGVVVSGDVSGNGQVTGVIRNTMFDNGYTVDLSSYAGTIKFDAESWYNLNQVYPSHGLPSSKLQFVDLVPPFKANDVVNDDYTITDTDFYSDVDFTTGTSDRACTLPTLADNLGRVIRISKVDSGAGKVTVSPEGAEEFLDGSTSQDLTSQGDTLAVVATTNGWKIF